MKKKVTFLATFILVLTLIFSCSKENELKSDDEIVLQKILNFKEKTENSKNLKSNEIISIDEAVWLIEAALNYTYCINEEEVVIENIQLDSLNIEVDIQDNSLLFSNVVNYYIELSEYMQNLNSDFKTQLVDISFEENNIKAKILFGQENMLKSATEILSYVPTNFMQADDILERDVNYHIRLTTPYGYYTDVETRSSIYGPYEYPLLRNPNSNDPCYMYYYLFYESSGDIDPYGTYSPILTVAEMNFYYNGVFTAANILKNNFNISNKRFISINLEADLMTSGEEYYPILHWADFRYGILHTQTKPPSDL